MFSVYVAYNRKHSKIYIGQSDNIHERMAAHNDKRFNHSYTSRFDGEWELLYKEDVATRNEALKRERQLKSFRGREFIKSFIPR